MAGEIKATPVRSEVALKLSDALRALRDQTEQTETAFKDSPVRIVPGLAKAVKSFIGQKPELLNDIAYGMPLTHGAKLTTSLNPEVAEAADFVPGGLLGKGAKMASVIGPIGLTALKDATVSLRYGRLLEALGKMNPRDWKSQMNLAEESGFVPIPRGRDREPGRPIIKVGYELPDEGKATPFMTEKSATLRSSPYTNYRMPLVQAWEQPELLRAYPDFKRTPIILDNEMQPGHGSHYPKSGNIKLGPSDYSSTIESVLRHELQHKIQKAEGWPGGTNTTMAGIFLDDLLNIPERFPANMQNRLWPILSKASEVKTPGDKYDLALNLYRQEAGEQMAEAVAKKGRDPVKGFPVSSYNTVAPSQMYDIRHEMPEYFPTSASDPGKKLPDLLRSVPKEPDTGRRTFLMRTGAQALSNLPEVASGGAGSVVGAGNALRNLVTASESTPAVLASKHVADAMKWMATPNFSKWVDDVGGVFSEREFKAAAADPKFGKTLAEKTAKILKKHPDVTPSEDFGRRLITGEGPHNDYSNFDHDATVAARKWLESDEKNKALLEKYWISGKIPEGVPESVKHLGSGWLHEGELNDAVNHIANVMEGID